uniref:Piwi domain-containing protein n=1 Tax=Panagrellus redivivus TaxID=6233 RepID=A0A7E4W091_PANRE
MALASDNEIIVTLNTRYEGSIITRTSQRTAFTSMRSPDEAARALADLVPPERVAGVFTIPMSVKTADEDYFDEQLAKALEAVGYTSIWRFETVSYQHTISLAESKIQNNVGDYVAVDLYDYSFNVTLVLSKQLTFRWRWVFQKTEHGYDYVRTVQSIDQMKSLFPNLTHVVVSSPKRLSSGPRRRLTADYAPWTVKFVSPLLKLAPYLWNLVEGGNFGGYQVTMDIRRHFLITYGDKELPVPFRIDRCTSERTVEIYIGTVPEIKVYFESNLIKNFTFEGLKRRIVRVVVSLDDHGFPNAVIKLLRSSAPTSVTEVEPDGTTTVTNPPTFTAPIVHVINAARTPFRYKRFNRVDGTASSTEYNDMDSLIPAIGQGDPQTLLIYHYDQREAYGNHKQIYERLTKTGCNVCFSNLWCWQLSSILMEQEISPLYEIVAVALLDTFFVLRRRGKRFCVIDVKFEDYDEVFSKYPINEIYVYDENMTWLYEAFNGPDSYDTYPPAHTLNVDKIGDNYGKLIYNPNFNGFLVKEFAKYVFTVKNGDREERFETGFVSLPHDFVKEIDTLPDSMVEIICSFYWVDESPVMLREKFDMGITEPRKISFVFTINSIHDIRIDVTAADACTMGIGEIMLRST